MRNAKVTNKQALSDLRYIRKVVIEKENWKNSLGVAIYAVKKNTPKLAIYDYEDESVKCPACGIRSYSGEYPERIRYCYNCGQALKVGE